MAYLGATGSLCCGLQQDNTQQKRHKRAGSFCDNISIYDVAAQ
jgi:hypothetical protein